ncbi:MAG: hypothetical protein QNJ22_15125 [Desulfosarcinaceae bacterium]|nr:hypothetical protein [Desulfosarcinaceae bacterium]
MRYRLFPALLLNLFCFLFLTGFIGLPVHPVTIEPTPQELYEKKRVIYRIAPEQRGGEAFKLVYLVPASIEIFWRFKTDFEGAFFESNRFIKAHRLIHTVGNVSITENSYTNVPNDTFRWRTTSDHRHYRMDFTLVNADECGHHFHYGSIQLEPFRQYTKVTHTAYFDFFGASLWVNMPFAGGMSSFLNYLARWEKETILQLIDHYSKHAANG